MPPPVPSSPAATGPRRALILLHGWTMTGRVFDGLAARLGPGLAPVAPDLPGHGTAADAPPTLAAGAETLARCIAAQAGSPPIVLGWSMGAAVAWEYIARHGCNALGGLVTVDMSPRMLNAPGWPHGLLGQSAADVAATTQRMAQDWGSITHSIAATMYATPEGAPGFSRAETRAAILTQDAQVMRRMWDALLAMDARDTIARIDCPYLVCRGAASRVYPASATEWICSTAPDARAQVFTRSGHSPHLEEPAAFARAIERFAATLG
ncbi:alpha/beta fold hydrolase [Sediminimonas sp.]|uniref:alpha/beta fold hydrolase n=1 Tax=Sediminimonas sp. TaxID=2823379 RepID=UPI0025EF8512|nr:alpha/beta fold hydrolase [Sediminimonas sp.]